MASQLSFLDTVPAGYHEMPAAPKPERCRSCSASIVWATTAGGAAIPLDVAGQITVAGKRYGRTHFITCPHGRNWRRAS